METKTYVKMCDCPEIQGHRGNLKDGDVLANYRKEWKETDKDTQKAEVILDEVLIFHNGMCIEDGSLII